MGCFSPFKIKRWLQRLCGDPVETAKVIRSGALLVQTRSTTQNIKLMGATNIDGCRCTAEVAVWLNSSEGVIYSPDLRSCSDEELLEELSPQGVIEVCRLRSNRGTPNPLIRLRFQGLVLPPRVMCGYLAVQVKVWTPRPVSAAGAGVLDTQTARVVVGLRPAGDAQTDILLRTARQRWRSAPLVRAVTRRGSAESWT